MQNCKEVRATLGMYLQALFHQYRADHQGFLPLVATETKQYPSSWRFTITDLPTLSISIT